MPKPYKRKRKLTGISIKEISAVGKPAQEGARIVVRKAADEDEAVEKGAALTSVEMDHTHLVRLVNYDGEDANSGYTGGADIPGENSYSYHTHPWVRTADGGITIGEAWGHTHTIATVGKAVDEEGIQMSKENTDAATAADNGKLVKELSDKVAVLTVEATFSDAERGFYKGLKDDATRKAFRDAAPDVRKAQIEEAARADEIYKAADGKTYKRSVDGEAAIRLAKQVDELKASTARAEAMAKAERENTKLRKEVQDDYRHLPGTEEHKVALLKATYAIEDADAREAAIKLLKSRDSGVAELMKTNGSSGAATLGTGDERIAKMAQMEKDWAEKNDTDLSKAVAHLAKNSKEYQGLYAEVHG